MKKYLILSFFLCLAFICNAIDIISRTESVISDKIIVSAYNTNGKVEFYEKIGNDYVELKNINSIVANGGEIMSPFISFDGRKLYFSARYEGKTNFDIYSSLFEDGIWKSPEVLSITLNSIYDELYPSLSPQGNEIFFVRRQIDQSSKSQREINSIYTSVKDLNGKWGTPKKIIISGDNDFYPVILPDGETVIFLSLREADGKVSKTPSLFYTKRLMNDNWMDPQMLSIGEKELVSYPYYSEKEKTINYFVKEKNNRFLEKSIDFKINQSPSVLIVGKVLEENPLSAQITVFHNLTNQPLLFSQAYKDGWFALLLPRERDYLIDFYEKGYTHFFYRVYSSALDDNSNLNLEVKLSKTLDLSFSIYDKLLYSPIEARIKVTDINNRLYSQLKPRKIGDCKYNLVLPLGRDYKLFFEKDGYESHCFEISKEKPIQFNVSELDVELTPNTKKLVFSVVDIETQEFVNDISIDLQNRILEEEFDFKSENGIVNAILREKDKYQMRVMAPGYIYKIGDFDMSQIEDKDTFFVELLPIKEGVVVQLQDVNFAYNSAELLEESILALGDIVEFMQANPEVRILLAAHTDDIGGANYNIKLSQMRAESVKKYLVEQGINAERLETKGFGMSEPLVPNDSEENRAKNRRVEFRIL